VGLATSRAADVSSCSDEPQQVTPAAREWVRSPIKEILCWMLAERGPIRSGNHPPRRSQQKRPAESRAAGHRPTPAGNNASWGRPRFGRKQSRVRRRLPPTRATANEATLIKPGTMNRESTRKLADPVGCFEFHFPSWATRGTAEARLPILPRSDCQTDSVRGIAEVKNFARPADWQCPARAHPRSDRGARRSNPRRCWPEIAFHRGGAEAGSRRHPRGRRPIRHGPRQTAESEKSWYAALVGAGRRPAADRRSCPRGQPTTSEIVVDRRVATHCSNAAHVVDSSVVWRDASGRWGRFSL